MAREVGAGLLAAGQQQQHQDPTQKFDRKEFDVTNKIESCCTCFWSFGICGWTSKTLVLEEEEAFLTVKNNCTNDVQRRPYAQLGNVDKSNTCTQ